MFSRPINLKGLKFGVGLFGQHPFGIYYRVLILQFAVATGSRPSMDYLMEKVFADYELFKWGIRFWRRIQGKPYKSV